MGDYEFEDPVHREFLPYEKLTLPGYCKKIIETAEFKRLRNIKQLGASLVFSEANHNRYDHSIGTAFLCKYLLDTLEKNSEKAINKLHKKCVIIAGLLHDIGHGPFSHLWEDVIHEGAHTKWKHENQSKRIVEQIFNNANGIRLSEDIYEHEKSLKLITSFITADKSVWNELLSPEEMFLTEFVSNSFCKIDVDKCDYLLRDSYYLKKKVFVKPFIDFLKRARIVDDVNGIAHIGYHCDDFVLIENLFYNRAYLHMNAYKHCKVLAAEKMVKDICIRAAAGGVKVKGFELTEVQENNEAYLTLDDSILDIIAESSIDNDNVIEAQRLIKNLKNPERRYSLVWKVFEYSWNQGVKKLHEELTKRFGDHFCVVKKVIPAAEVPDNVPLYIMVCCDDELKRVQMRSKLRLSFESQMIFCKSLDRRLVNEVRNDITLMHINL